MAIAARSMWLGELDSFGYRFSTPTQSPVRSMLPLVSYSLRVYPFDLTAQT